MPLNHAGWSSFWVNEFPEKLGLPFCWSYVNFCPGGGVVEHVRTKTFPRL